MLNLKSETRRAELSRQRKHLQQVKKLGINDEMIVEDRGEFHCLSYLQGSKFLDPSRAKENKGCRTRVFGQIQRRLSETLLLKLREIIFNRMKQKM